MASRHLLNPLAPLDQPTPSSLDGVPPTLERDLRAYGAILIQQAGIMLNAPQSVLATAQVLFQRFWFVTSMKHFGIRDIGLGALFLSSKLEESPLKLRDLINAYSYLTSLSAFCSSPPYPAPASFTYTPMDYFAPEFYDLKDALVVAEMQLLKRLAFMTQVQAPYGFLINYLKQLELSDQPEFVRKCWGYVNDLLQTPFPALYPQTTLALTAIYLAARLSTPPVALPLTPVPWWEHFDATEAEILTISKGLLGLYRDWGGADGIGGPGPGDVSVWRKGGELPIDKNGVRKLIEGGKSRSRNGSASGSADGRREV